MLVRGGAPARSGVEVFLHVGDGRSLLRLERRDNNNRHKGKTAVAEEGWCCKHLSASSFSPLTNRAVCACRCFPQWRSELVSGR